MKTLWSRISFGKVSVVLTALGLIYEIYHRTLDKPREPEPVLDIVGGLFLVTGVVLFLLEILLDQRRNERAIAELRESAAGIREFLKWRDTNIDELFMNFENTRSVPHQYSGFSSLKSLVETYIPDVRKSLNHVDNFHLKEPLVLPSYLKNLASMIPEGSVWLGISLVNLEVWRDTNNSLNDFTDVLQKRTSSGSISVYRLFAMSNIDKSYPEFKELVNKFRNSRFLLKCKEVDAQPVQDITIILLPPAKPTQRLQEQSPFHSYTVDHQYRALCTIAFTIVNSHWIKKMEIMPESDTNVHGDAFDRLWNSEDSKRNVPSLALFLRTWRGTGVQTHFRNQKDAEFEIDLTLNHENNGFVGEYRVDFGNGSKFTFAITGGEIAPVTNKLTLQYQDVTNPERFGTLYLCMQANTSDIEGNFIGFGPTSVTGVVSGSLSLQTRSEVPELDATEKTSK